MNLWVDPRSLHSRPTSPVRQHTLRPSGLAPLDALIATPPDPVGVLLYFPGFNTPLGPWEIAKCAHLADATSLTVVLTEIPGMSRFADPIPKAVRKDMLTGRVESWADLNLSYIDAAMRVGEVRNPEYMQVLGYSTGCSLAVASLPVLAEWGPIEGLNLVEPVAISQRNVASLQAHNLADWGRMGTVLATNRGSEWVMSARRRQRREPSVKYSAVDLRCDRAGAVQPGAAARHGRGGARPLRAGARLAQFAVPPSGLRQARREPRASAGFPARRSRSRAWATSCGTRSRSSCS